MQSNQLTVDRAAIKDDDGVIHSVPRPGRHHHVIHQMVIDGHMPPVSGNQGFILSDGTFADRFRAKEVAVAAGQLLPTSLNLAKLFSEDVW